ncbi:MAG: hypothetical protein GXX00_14060 [Hungateiclostridium thermocellum]|jgi:uncharacterized protein YwgA|nr:hypothetical protein [Acetivibrio thermocellus]
MKARDVFLITLRHAGNTISGRTLIQKRAFFLDLKLNLGLGYKPHYYGPYSPQLDAAIGQCIALRFVNETVIPYGWSRTEGFEIKRYDYTLTDDGLAVVDAIMNREKALCESIFSCLDKIIEAGDLDYNQLSVAAKAVWILRESKRPMLPEHIAAEAKGFGWEVSSEAIEKVISFLENLGIVSTSTSCQA